MQLFSINWISRDTGGGWRGLCWWGGGWWGYWWTRWSAGGWGYSGAHHSSPWQDQEKVSIGRDLGCPFISLRSETKRNGSENEWSEIAKKCLVSLWSETENFVCETKWLEAKNIENMHTQNVKADQNLALRLNGWDWRDAIERLRLNSWIEHLGLNSWIKQLRLNSWYWTAEIEQLSWTAEIERLWLNSWDWTAEIEQLGLNSWDWTAGLNSWD